MSNKLSWKTVGSYALSIGLASAVLFLYGYHPTIDAILVTLVWLILGAVFILTLILIGVTVFVVRENSIKYDESMGKFYKTLEDMHVASLQRFISFAIIGYWFYVLIVQEWTSTAVLYTISTITTQVYIFATRNLAKEYFIAKLKGEGAKHE